MKTSPYFSAHLFLRNVLNGMKFYEQALGAVELRRWSNDDGSVHVAEMEIGGAMFHIHEEVPKKDQLSPETVKAITSSISLFVDDPHAVVDKAVRAGAVILNAVEDYDYGFRQGTIIDPFGHQWLIQKKI